jgi:hypothetical protein
MRKKERRDLAIAPSELASLHHPINARASDLELRCDICLRPTFGSELAHLGYVNRLRAALTLVDAGHLGFRDTFELSFLADVGLEFREP